MATTIRERAQALADKTADAYSWDNYSGDRWQASIAMLLRRGYSDREAEAIMRSKWTRWAGDMASGRKGYRYGLTNSADLARFLDSMKADERARQVAELVAGTFGTGEV